MRNRERKRERHHKGVARAFRNNCCSAAGRGAGGRRTTAKDERQYDAITKKRQIIDGVAEGRSVGVTEAWGRAYRRTCAFRPPDRFRRQCLPRLESARASYLRRKSCRRSRIYTIISIIPIIIIIMIRTRPTRVCRSTAAVDHTTWVYTAQRL